MPLAQSCITKSRIEEALAVERARIILARLASNEIPQAARDLKGSVPTVMKWCKQFSLWRLRGLPDDSRSGQPAGCAPQK